MFATSSPPIITNRTAGRRHLSSWTGVSLLSPNLVLVAAATLLISIEFGPTDLSRAAAALSPDRHNLSNLSNRTRTLAGAAAAAAGAGAGRNTGTNRRLQRPQRDANDYVQLAGSSSSNGGRVYGPAEATELDQVTDLDVDNGNAEGNLLAAETEVDPVGVDASFTGNSNRRPLQIVRLFAPEAVRNGQENVTIDCMFKFDKKLDQRLTVKWYFNDELEPIYQWIPELNKRVYSDKYEQFIDKNYAVSDDIDYLLGAYRILQQQTGVIATTGAGAAPDLSDEQIQRRALAERLDALASLGGQRARQLIGQVRAALALGRYPAAPPNSGGGGGNNVAASDNLSVNDETDQLLIGGALNGQSGQHQNQIAARYKSFRALRLVRPTTELSGRYTCSVSSLDSDALASTNLLVYEPARSFTFNVTRAPNQQYNLTCRAGPAFPRPSLALFRYRAGPTDSPGAAADQTQVQAVPASSAAQARPRGLASTQLRQEPLMGLQTHITISTRQVQPNSAAADLTNDIANGSAQRLNGHQLYDSANEFATEDAPEFASALSKQQWRQQTAANSNSLYEIVAWALVDESTLSYNLATQFECQLTIEGAINYQRRQSLALQRGWHVSQPMAGSAALTARSTLVGVLSALASILCLSLALVSTLVVFKMLRRYASVRRVHSGPAPTNGRFGAGTSTGPVSTISARVEGGASKQVTNTCSNDRTSLGRFLGALWQPQEKPRDDLHQSSKLQAENVDRPRSPGSLSSDGHCSTSSTTGESTEKPALGAITEPEGVYRVPGGADVPAADAASSRPTSAGLAFGTRLVIGGGNRWPPCNGVPVYGLYANTSNINSHNNAIQTTQTAADHGLEDSPQHQVQQQLANSFGALSAAQVAAAAADGLPRTMMQTDRREQSIQQQQQRQTIAVNGKALYC